MTATSSPPKVSFLQDETLRTLDALRSHQESGNAAVVAEALL